MLRTKTVLQKLLLYTVTRGLLVTVIQLTFLILFESATEKLDWCVGLFSFNF
jgi:hypothetical protein